ncbi:hypothetical protein AGMMS49587_18870 [Spirochaetia bacterium]|nr:hypothetical protein AGMMS49587_18870 [Spirochaetia bacterium]
MVFYYQCYDDDGNRINGHSTGESTRTMAIKRCNALMRVGKLLPNSRKRIPTFGEYSAGWWVRGECGYLKKKLGRKELGPDYEKQSRRMLDMFLVPYFGKMRVDKISTEDIDQWLVNFNDREHKKPGKKIKAAGENGAAVDGVSGGIAPDKYKESYINVVFGILKLMLKEAVKRRLIPFNPADNVEKLQAERKQVEILTLHEAQEMFIPKHKEPEPKLLEEFDKKGFNMAIGKLANMVAMVSGMRIGEVLGLKGEFVFADYIRVEGQYGSHGFGPTKTRKKRNIPLAPGVMAGLQKVVELNGEGYVFSTDGGAKPITRYYFNKALTKGLAEIGINETEKKARNITPHAWRHFLNSVLRALGVPDAVVQSITGHSSQSMTEYYTHFNLLESSKVRNIQDSLLLAAPLDEGEPAAETDDGEPGRRAASPVKRTMRHISRHSSNPPAHRRKRHN